MFGLLPAGTERAEVRLSDGRVVPARVVDGFFAATWTGGPANPDPEIAVR